MLETTREKAARLLSPEVRAVLRDNDLMIVDRQDFEVVMEVYYEVRRMRIENRKLKAERRNANVERPDSSGSG